ncbi:asparaginase [Kribbella sp. NBC_01245]|uniref:asparaginase n=1 Tax=Kribbella sp. NBC_01245 TaxID=2903578 RepID=UPI002E2A36D4|nr:asparaginase [Kribbella sp. NBC_01245]
MANLGVPRLDSVAQLAEVVRNGFVESRHFGMAVALSPSGEVLYGAGDFDGLVLPRSTAKPLQAVGSLVAGAELDLPQTAVAAGSHTGEDQHVRVVRAILASVDLTEDALGCPPDWPENEGVRFGLIRGFGGPERILMNCSGKHAAMLAATVASGNNPTSYLSPASHVQSVVQSELSRLSTPGPVESLGSADSAVVTVDGCGAPLYALPLRGLARAFGRLALAAPGSPEAQVANAMRTHPTLVGGTGHLNSEVMRLLPGVIAKGGAEGVLAMASPDGHAVAVKVIDGNPRATTALALALLAKTGLDVSPAAALTEVPIFGGGTPVGTVRPTL